MKLLTLGILLGFLPAVCAAEGRPAAAAPVAAQDSGVPETTAKAWVVMEAGSGKVLAKKDGDAPYPMASTTKVMTALVALTAIEEQNLLDEKVTISPQAAKVGGTRMGLKEGDVLTLQDLFYGMMLPSGNDAATAIAEFVALRMKWTSPDPNAKSPEEAAFVSEMNRFAGRISLKATRYLNSHGMAGKGHVSSAEDVAVLYKAALEKPFLKEVMGTAERQVKVLNGNQERTIRLKNTNKVLGKNGVETGKTGDTRGAGSCLVSSAVSPQGSIGSGPAQRLIVVILGCPKDQERYDATAVLLRWGWSHLPSAAGKTPAK